MADFSTQAGALERATSLYDLISEQAATGEQLGYLADRVATSLLDGKLLSILIPRRDGGLGGSRLDFFDAVEAIARADGSAGWCTSVCNAVNYAAFVGLPQEGREEVFGHGPVSCWTALAPNAIATAAVNGFRVSCPGSFGSGSSLSQWVLIAGNAGAAGEGRYRAFLVPKTDVEIKQGSWDVMGLRATASIDYAITDQFVPARRSWEYDWLSADGHGPLSATDVIRLNAIGLTAFASGVGQRALSELITSAKKTRRVVAEGVQADDNVVQYGIGELDGRMRAARSHLMGLVSAWDERAVKRRATSVEEGLEVFQACQILARASRDMVVFAFDYAGTSVIYARQPLQRCLRDIFTGLKHAAFTPAHLSMFGKTQLGMLTARSPI
jgi:alkylation response protein AidB-like acyl-CoA dehydrogenase